MFGRVVFAWAQLVQVDRWLPVDFLILGICPTVDLCLWGIEIGNVNESADVSHRPQKVDPLESLPPLKG